MSFRTPNLPEIPSAKEVEVNRIQLGEMNKLLLKKVGEFTLHLIEKDKQLEAVRMDLKNAKDDADKKLEAQKTRLNELEQAIHDLIKKSK